VPEQLPQKPSGKVKSIPKPISEKSKVTLPAPIKDLKIFEAQPGKSLWVCGKQTHPPWLSSTNSPGVYWHSLNLLGGQWIASKKCWYFTIDKKKALLDLFGLTENDIGVQTVTKTQIAKPLKTQLPTLPTKNVHIEKTATGKGLWVCGETFPYKDQLKGMNGQWYKSKHCWLFNLKQKQDLLTLFGLQEEDIVALTVTKTQITEPLKTQIAEPLKTQIAEPLKTQKIQISEPLKTQLMTLSAKNVYIEKTATGKGLWVCGETQPYKDKLKSMGGKWNKSKECWIFSLKEKPSLLTLFGLQEEDIVALTVTKT
jgi:hypothetical protein